MTSPLARWVSGQTLFLRITGLSVVLLPTSVFNRHAVLLHIALGPIFLPPFLLYTWRHVRDDWDDPLSHGKFTGWVSGGMAVVRLLFGVLLTWNGLFDVRRSETWRMVHIVTTVGLVDACVVLGPKLAVLSWAR